MQFRKDKNGEDISVLGYGCMRFSRRGGIIDYSKAEREVLHAIDLGVNYFDTAYIYPGSEACLGKILEKNGCRKKINIATKLPQFNMRSIEQVEKTFNEQLSRLRTDYVDYYLMHMFTDIAEWNRLTDFAIEDWIEKKKSEGKIRNIGFSFHGNSAMFLKILDAYDWDFCQIQYNYLDENTQGGRVGLETAEKKGIPVVIMEPLRGGKLVRIPKKAQAHIKSAGYTPAELAFCWLYNQKGVTCVLSGMNSVEMLEENVRIASSCLPGSFNDAELIKQTRKLILEKEKVGCTGCAYCMPCPQGVDIPSTFLLYNMMYIEGKFGARFEYGRNLGLREKQGFASQCIKCGKCESHCPQHINITEKLTEADKALRPLPYKVGIDLFRKFIYRKNNRSEIQ